MIKPLITGDGKVEASALYRESLIQYGIEWFKESPFFGYGLENFRVLNSIDYGNNVYAHNNFIEILVGLGLVGFLIYYFLYAYILIKLLPLVKKKSHNGIIIFTLLLISLFMDYASVSYDSKLTWIYFAVGFIVIKRYEDKHFKTESIDNVDYEVNNEMRKVRILERE